MDLLSMVLLTKNTSDIPVFGPIWNAIVSVLGMLMNLIYVSLSNIGIGNIGLAIIIFTFITKIILFPSSINQQKSSRMMQVIQPEIKAIQDKYKNKTDNASMMAQQEETKAVYAKYGTSMTGGCLPMLIQMPIIFALYRIIMNIPAYVPAVRSVFDSVSAAIGGSASAQKLVDFANNNNWKSLLQGLHNLGLDDTSKYDSSAVENFIVDFLNKLNPTQWSKLAEAFPDASSTITAAAAQSAHINNFLGINLSTAPIAMGYIPNIYWLIPILAGLTQWISTKMMSTQTQGAAASNDQSAQMMNSMTLMMPLMSVWFCFTFASGIGLYWIASSVMVIIQQFFLNSHFAKVSNEEFLQQAMEKANAKRAKKGLPPIDEKSVQKKIEKLQEQSKVVESGRMDVIARQNMKTKESTDYYNKNAKPGSLASKASMVQMYNEKHDNKNKNVSTATTSNTADVNAAGGNTENSSIDHK